MRIPFAAAATALVVLAAAPARAQKAPDVGYAFPSGGRAGSSVEVRLGGYDWTPDLQYFVHDPRVRLEVLGPPGPILLTPPPYWFGVKSYSAPPPLPREVRARLTLPAGLPAGPIRWQVANANGASGTGVFVVSHEPEIVEDETRATAQELPSLPTTISGRLDRVEDVDRYRFRAEHTGLVACELFARRLGADVHLAVEVRDRRGDVIADLVDTEGRDPLVRFPAVAGEEYEVAIHDLDFRGDWAYVYRLAVREEPSGVRDAPRAPAPDGAARLGLPGTADGVLSAAAPDWRWRTDGKQGELWRFSLESRALGSGWDVSLALLGPDGKEVAQNDDLPGTSDSGFEVRLAASGTYTLVVTGIGARSTPPGPFRLTAERARADFELRTVQRLNVPTGGKADLKITVTRQGGFQGPIRVRLHNLPPGFLGAPETIIPAGAPQISVPISLDGRAAVTAGMARAEGTADIAGTTVTHSVLVPAEGSLSPRSPSALLTEQLLLCGTLKAPFKVLQPDREGGRRVPRGAEFPADILIERDAGYGGEVVLQMSSRQDRYRQGISGPDLLVSGAVSRAEYPVFWPEWLETSRTSRMVLVGVGKVLDPTGRERFLTVPLDGRITVWIEGALLKIEAEEKEPALSAGGTATLSFRLSRAPRLTEPVQVELLPPPELVNLVDTAPVVAAPGSDRVILALRTRSGTHLPGEHTFTARAVTRTDGRWRVQAETTITLRAANPSGGARKVGRSARR